MARRDRRVTDGARIMVCVLSAIAVTPSVAVVTPLALALTAGCDLVQWCAARSADVADVVAGAATEYAEAARWVAAIGRTA